MNYFWYTITGESEVWKLAKSDQRHHIISNTKPMFVTVLDASAVPNDEWTREDHLKMKYSGPLYFDWDSQDISKSIRDFQRTLVKLQADYDVDLECIRLYATGGRGFHVEIPMEIFVGKVPPGGIVQLPYIYREMAIELATDSLDLKVYSGRRGRMWRVCNVRRSNDHYKVQISVSEALAMTPELYDKLTSTDRSYLAIKAPTSVAVGLQALFSSKKDMVEATVKRAAKVKDERQELARFNGEFPTSVKLLMAGKNLRTDIGFNNISLQFAILAVAMGKTVEQMLEACEGFIQEHTSDGRYNSPRKRREALRERYHYVEGNPCYVFSFGALLSICEPGYQPSELAPQSDASVALATAAVNAPVEVRDEDGRVDVEATLAALDEATPAELKLAKQRATANSLGGLVVTGAGVFQATKEGESLLCLSQAGFLSTRMLMEASSARTVLGFETHLTVTLPGGATRKGSLVEVEYDNFSSSVKLDRMLSSHLASFTGSDTQARNVRQFLTNQTMESNEILYVVRREGLDVIPDPRNNTKHMMLWASKSGVVLAEDVPDDPRTPVKPSRLFTYRAGLVNNAVFSPDVHEQDALQPSVGASEYVRHLLRFSRRDATVANGLGWFVSCFHRQIHHHLHGQFPLLQFYGQAGSGKTTTPQMLAAFFWVRERRGTSTAAKGAASPLSRRAQFVGSCSPPMLLDEIKRTELGEMIYGDLMGQLRASYNAAVIESAGISDGSAETSYRTIRSFPRSTPVCLMSETIIAETAIMERCVMVPMSQRDQWPEHWQRLDSPDGRIKAGQLGARLLWRSLRTSLETYEQMYRDERARLQAEISFAINERPLVNLTIIWCGLRFLQATLEEIGIDESERFDELRSATIKELEMSGSAAPTPEVYKFLQDVAHMVNSEIDNDFEMTQGKHYIASEENVEISVRDLSVKYFSWCKTRGIRPWYSDHQGVVQALVNCDATVDRVCAGSGLRRMGSVQVIRLDARRLIEMEVAPFRQK